MKKGNRKVLFGIFLITLGMFGGLGFGNQNVGAAAQTAKVTVNIKYFDTKAKKIVTKKFKTYKVKKGTRFSLEAKKLPNKASNTRKGVGAFKVTKNITKTINYTPTIVKYTLNYTWYDANGKKKSAKLKDDRARLGATIAIPERYFPKKSGNTKKNFSAVVTAKGQTFTANYSRNTYKVHVEAITKVGSTWKMLGTVHDKTYAYGELFAFKNTKDFKNYTKTGNHSFNKRVTNHIWEEVIYEAQNVSDVDIKINYKLHYVNVHRTSEYGNDWRASLSEKTAIFSHTYAVKKGKDFHTEFGATKDKYFYKLYKNIPSFTVDKPKEVTVDLWYKDAVNDSEAKKMDSDFIKNMLSYSEFYTSKEDEETYQKLISNNKISITYDQRHKACVKYMRDKISAEKIKGEAIIELVQKTVNENMIDSNYTEWSSLTAEQQKLINSGLMDYGDCWSYTGLSRVYYTGVGLQNGQFLYRDNPRWANGSNHACNIVYVDGKFFNVDTEISRISQVSQEDLNYEKIIDGKTFNMGLMIRSWFGSDKQTSSYLRLLKDGHLYNIDDSGEDKNGKYFETLRLII